MRLHSIYQSAKVPGRLRWKFVLRGIALYDPRKDTSVGGDGDHRHDDLSTHEWTDNLAVIAYNILRGIYVADANGDRQFFYGLEGTDAAALPFDLWTAAMDLCDVDVDLDGGGTEKQFRAGGEISVDTEPMEALKELMKSCGGDVIELGGVYVPLIGEPGDSGLVISDGDLLGAAEDTFNPVLGLEQRINQVTGSYTSPADGWITKVAPPRENTDWRAEDGRRLPADLNAPMVQSGTQMQRVMQQLLNRSRDQRTHVATLGPQAFHLLSGRTLTWNSTRNGYVAKKFKVKSVAYHPNCDVTLSIVETDPAHYDWSTSDELPEVPSPPIVRPPVAKVIVDFDAQPYLDQGDNGTKRPAILLTWADPEDGDIIGVAWQVRRVSDPANVRSGQHDDPTDEAIVISGGFNPNTAYEVRARFVSQAGFETEWSLWQEVVTDDVGITSSELDAIVRARIESIGGALQLVDYIGQLILQTNQALLGVQSRVDEISASSLARFTAIATPADALAALELQVRAQAGQLWAQAAMQLIAYANTDGTAASRMRFIADMIEFGVPGATGGDFISLFEIGNKNGVPQIVLKADAIRDNGVTKESIVTGALTTIITLDDADQNRTFNAWNNGGAGEEFSTLTCALSGDGVVIIELMISNDSASSFTSITGHFITIEANGVEILRRDVEAALFNPGNGDFHLKIAVSDLPAGTNTLVGKLRLNDSGTGGSDNNTVYDIRWIVTEHHRPAVQAGGASAATHNFNAPILTSASANDPTFSAHALAGGASPFRRVVLGIGYRSATQNLTGVTVVPSSGPSVVAERVDKQRVSTTALVAEIWEATVPAGTTIDIVLATTGPVSDLAVGVLDITTAAEAAIDFDSDPSATGSSPLVIEDLEIQDDGVVVLFVYAFRRDTFAASWSGADSPTEHAEGDIGECHYGIYSFLTTEGTVDDDLTVTHAADGSNPLAVAVAASWR